MHDDCTKALVFHILIKYMEEFSGKTIKPDELIGGLQDAMSEATMSINIDPVKGKVIIRHDIYARKLSLEIEKRLGVG